MNISDADVAGHVGSKSELSVGNNAMSAPSGNANSKAVRPNIWIHFDPRISYLLFHFLIFLFIFYRIVLVPTITEELIHRTARSKAKIIQCSRTKANSNRMYRTKEVIDKMPQAVWRWHRREAYPPKCNNTMFPRATAMWVIAELTIIEMRIFFAQSWHY